MKHDFNPRKNVQIDGISGKPPVRFSQPGRGNVPNRQSVSGGNSRDNSISDFRRPEGFNPSAQPQIQTSTHYQEQIIIDRHTTKRKKKLFGRKNHDKGPKKKLSRKKKVLRFLVVLLVILLAVGGFLFAKGYITLSKILPGGGGAIALQKNVDPSKLNGEGDGRVNILIAGIGGEGHEAPDLTDTLIIASIDPIAKEASLVSIPRDLYVKVPDQGWTKVNAAYAEAKYAYQAKQTIKTSSDKEAVEAGFNILENALESTLGLPIHYHVLVDFSGFKQAVDTVGGVSLNVPSAVSETMRIDGKTYNLDVKPGQQTMDGFKALAYSRSRYTSVRGDFDRAERQRLIITALKDKILSVGTFSNPQKISGLLNNFGSHVQTNLSIADMQRVYQLSQEIPSNKIGSIGLADPPNNFLQTANVGGLSVVLPTAGQGNYLEIQSFMRNSLKDSFLKSESASIMVLNGTNTSGLATTKGDELKSFGYTVPNVANAPTRTYTKTIVVNLRGNAKKYTQAYLEKRFNTQAVTSIPDPAIVPGDADFVIILGTDQAGTQ